MAHRLSSFAFVLLVLGVTTTQAGTLFAIMDDTRDLIAIDPDSLSVTTIGATGIATGSFGDLAYDEANGVMYWVAGRGNDSMYTINLTTGAATLIGAHGVNDLFSLGYDGTNLYGQSTSGVVYQIDKTTAVATSIGSNNTYPGGYDWNSSTGSMISLSAGGGEFTSVNLTTGASTLLAAPGTGINDCDLAYDLDRNIYWAIDYSGFLFRYDATTFARSTALAGMGVSASLEYVRGNINPVPEPGTIALAGVGLVGLALVRLRNRRCAS